MKRTIAILLSICIFKISFAQNISFSDSISILGKTSIYLSDNSSANIILLENGQNRDADFLPIITRQATAGIFSNIQNIVVTKAEYTSVNADLLKGIYNIDKITENIQVNARISRLRKQNIVDFEIMPLRKNNATGEYEIAKYFECNVILSGEKRAESSRTYASSSKLASGNWYKIKVAESGVYKLTYEQLKEMGFSNFSNIGIFGYGGMISKIINDNTPSHFSEIYHDDMIERPVIKVDANNNSTFDAGDYILFYAEGPHNIKYNVNGKFSHEFHNYSDFAYYFVSDRGTWKSATPIAQENSSNVSVTTYDKYVFQEKDSISIIKSGRIWYWRNFDFYQTINLSFSEDYVTSDSATLYYHLAANSSIASYFDVTANTTNKRISIPSSSSNGSDVSGNFKFIPSGSPIPVKVVYTKTASSSKGYIDYIALKIRKRLNYENGFITFRDTKSVGAGNIAEFTISQSPSNLIVWDISDVFNAKRISGTYSNNQYKFKAAADTLKEYIAINPSYSFPAPIYNDADDIGKISNQNLHATGNADLLIITHKNFYSQAVGIKQMHETNDNMSVVLATTDEIYNEFSSGAKDICAIRNYIKMFYDRASANNIPKNVLLVGDGSYNNKANDPNVSNFIPTFQTENSLTKTLSTCSDDFFVCLDEGEGNIAGNEKMDMGIGRLTVKSTDEAQIVLDKISQYYSKDSWGNWKNKITLVADDAENNEVVHQNNTENILAMKLECIAPTYNIEKIYLDDYEQISTTQGARYPEVNQAIIDNFNNGTCMFTWVGHGNEKGWAHENIFTLNSISSLQNKYKYPLLFTATCEFSPYDDHGFVSGGEQLLISKDAGPIALVSTVRQVYSTKNENLVSNIYTYLFDETKMYNTDGSCKTIGECFASGKNITSDFNMRSFALLGDPAITLTRPKFQVRTDKINGIPVHEFTDTIGATGRVTIEGKIYDKNGNFAENFNGTVYPTVYDKRNTYTTKSNDGYPALTYTAQRNIIFNGRSSVKNGQFKFSFIVPIDIAYFYEKGKISYYANNEVDTEAQGFDNSFTIGGTDANGITDTQGPEISLFMNDENFIEGGIVNQTPLLLAKISDESGINTIGNGIGHDITMMLDDNTSEKKVLNSFYEAEKDNYQNGEVRYPNTELELGAHTIILKAWDVMNNSSEKSIDFIVANSSEMIIDKLFNYPNPFSTNTSFYFGHNQPYQQLQVLISIFTVSGKLVKTLETTMTCDGYLSEPIKWDGRDDYGDKIDKGVYVYRVKVRNDTGTVVEKFEKLVILN